jgi:MFS family permease
MIAGSTGTYNFFTNALGAILLLYFVLPSPDGLGVSQPLVSVTAGLIFSISSIGALVGVALATRITRIVGVRRAIVLSELIEGLGSIPYFLSGSLTASPLFTLAGSGINWYTLLIIAGQLVTNIAVVVYNVNQISLRQSIVPIRMQGRMNATMRFLVWGTIPLGGLAGGLLGTFLGLRQAVGIAVIGGSLAFLWVLFSPVRTLKKIPEPLE